MALFTPEEIESVKRSVDLVGLIRASGVELQQKGRNWVGLCPFHDDNHPSLLVTPENGLWNCLGACRNNGHKAGGDAVAWLMRSRNMSFVDAMRELGGNATPPARKKGPESPQKAKTSRPEGQLLDLVVTHYHETLLRSKEARAYLEKRKLWEPELMRSFRVGFVDGSLVAKLGRSPMKKDLRAIGVLTGSGRELLSGSVVVPILQDNQVVNLYGRHTAKPQHRYLPGPRRGLFNARGARDAERLVLCESILDALSLILLGEPGALPLWGINGWTEDHERFVKTWRGSDLVVALDADDAGRETAQELTDTLSAHSPRTLDLGAWKDPNELLMKAEDPVAAWQSLVTPPLAPLVARSSTVGEEEEAAKEEKASTPAGLSFSFGERRYGVRGLRARGLDKLRVTVRLEAGGRFHLDTLDLYSHRAREQYAQAAGKILEIDGDDVGRELLLLTDKLEAERLRMRDDPEAEEVALSPAERTEAMALLRDPGLLDRILDDMEALGCVGEREALALGVLGTVSRLLDKPLGLLLLARSGAGKSTVQDAVTDFVPDESLVKYTRITGQALFYKEEEALVHKVLAIEEDAGAESAAYAIRNLQSSQVLTIAATRTDPATGKLRSDSYRVKGPVFIMLTTTSPEALDYETRNRFLEVTVNETHEQTERILRAQREEDTLDGLLRQAKREKLMRLHQNAQRLLRPLKVLNPFASEITYPSQGIRMRREQKKYLTLMKAMALLHQHQREIKRAERDGVGIEYVEITAEDIRRVNQLAGRALSRGLDELSPPGRALHREIRRLVKTKGEQLREEVPTDRPVPGPLVCRKELRDATGWSDWQLRVHLRELVDLEYISVVFGGNGRRTQYALLEDLDDGPPAFLEDPAETL